MARIKDKRIHTGKANRNRAIREYFSKRWNEGIRWEVIIDEIINRWGIGESTIYQIVKGIGSYKPNEQGNA